ncbi:hypothetical protein NL676_026587 [Syzygium grande]|nr:hypothetical protein NL676_026587 [Syzygium grande]
MRLGCNLPRRRLLLTSDLEPHTILFFDAAVASLGLQKRRANRGLHHMWRRSRPVDSERRRRCVYEEAPLPSSSVFLFDLLREIAPIQDGDYFGFGTHGSSAAAAAAAAEVILLRTKPFAEFG